MSHHTRAAIFLCVLSLPGLLPPLLPHLQLHLYLGRSLAVMFAIIIGANFYVGWLLLVVFIGNSVVRWNQQRAVA